MLWPQRNPVNFKNIYSLNGLYEDDEYFEKLLLFKVLLPHWLARIGFHKTREEK